MFAVILPHNKMLESESYKTQDIFPLSLTLFSFSPKKLDLHVSFLSLYKCQPGHKVRLEATVQCVHIASFLLFLVLRCATVPDVKAKVTDKMENQSGLLTLLVGAQWSRQSLHGSSPVPCVTRNT